MNSFIYTQPVKIYFGQDKFLELESIIKELKLKKCIVVSDKYFENKAKDLVNKYEFVQASFSDIEPNPQLKGAIEVSNLAKKYNADAIIGIGGGSTIDTAKFAAAIALAEDDAISYYNGEKPFPEKRLPIIAVPTTAGTGSEVTQVSVMSHGTIKRTINNPAFMPLAAIVDPNLSKSVPAKVTMITGLDALAHALEGYWSKNHQPISDIIAIEAVRIILDNLLIAYKNGQDMNARSNMAYASLLGGLSFALPKTAACHACSYPLSEDYHLSHGEACAFTLDSFVRINADDRLEELCRRVGLKSTTELASRIAEFKEIANLKSHLTDLGDVNMDKLIKDCLNHPLMNNNPKKLNEDDLRKMFEALK